MDNKDKQLPKKRLLTERALIDEGYPFTLSWLRSKRVTGGGIPFIKIGSLVFYMPEDAEAYIAAHRVTSTTEAAHV